MITLIGSTRGKFKKKKELHPQQKKTMIPLLEITREENKQIHEQKIVFYKGGKLFDFKYF